MTASSIGRAVGQAQGSMFYRPPEQERARVWRHSRNVGERELHLWRPVPPEEINAIIQAAQEFDRRTRPPGRRNGQLGGHIAVEVLEWLYRKVDYASGRLEPAILTICAGIGRSKNAVCKALKQLKDHGWLDWQRRTVPTGKEVGPQVEQATNAYVFGVPDAWVGWIARKLGRKPTDAVHASKKIARAYAAWKRNMPTTPLPDRAREWLKERAAKRSSASHQRVKSPASDKG